MLTPRCSYARCPLIPQSTWPIRANDNNHFNGVYLISNSCMFDEWTMPWMTIPCIIIACTLDEWVMIMSFHHPHRHEVRVVPGRYVSSHAQGLVRNMSINTASIHDREPIITSSVRSTAYTLDEWIVPWTPYKSTAWMSYGYKFSSPPSPPSMGSSRPICGQPPPGARTQYVH